MKCLINYTIDYSKGSCTYQKFYMLDVAVLISEVDTHSKLQRHYSLPSMTL